jgi:biopolymer transport protein ExbB
MQETVEFSSLAFIIEAGPIAIFVALILLLMSMVSWVVIVVKALEIYRKKQSSQQYLEKFWLASTLGQALKLEGENIFAEFAKKSVQAAEHYQAHVNQKSLNRESIEISKDEFLARTMNRAIVEEGARLEHGLTALASIGSVAPFVGLFGTVWGIYHALAAISLSGQASLDKVAGPVGEALIMTAIGLAVAIPAVLAYNAFLRSNRAYQAKLEQFAHELHMLLITGSVMTNGAVRENNSKEKPLQVVEVSA